MENIANRRSNNPHIQDFMDSVIKKSWTWERLTCTEKAMANGVLTAIQSKAQTQPGVSSVVNRHYSVVLKTLGYQPKGWREGLYVE